MSRAGTGPSGLLVVDKPPSMTSHDVVARVRRLAGTRRVGHAGTLDPMATGVLLLGVNRATRLLGRLALTDKSYDATVRLGSATTTDDAEGEVIATTPASHLDPAAVEVALGAFVGDLDQVPSSVSAVKVAGRRAHQRIRDGEVVVLPPRRVRIHALVVTGVRVEGRHVDVDMSLSCSSGTYVRALARDLGAALGVGGHLTALRRTTVGPVDLASATPLATLEATREVPLMSMEQAARTFFVTVDLDADGAREVGFGRALARPETLDPAPAGPLALLGPDGAFLALYEASGPSLRPVAVFV